MYPFLLESFRENSQLLIIIRWKIENRSAVDRPIQIFNSILLALSVTHSTCYCGIFFFFKCCPSTVLYSTFFITSDFLTCNFFSMNINYDGWKIGLNDYLSAWWSAVSVCVILKYEILNYFFCHSFLLCVVGIPKIF